MLLMVNWTITEELIKKKKEIEKSNYDAYCFYVLSGTETTICNELNNNYENILALPILKIEHRSKNGEKYDVETPLLPGYIFAFVPENDNIFEFKTSQYYFRVLDKENDYGKLYGDDLEYANWVKSTNGIIPVSEAIKIDNKVKIISGPLKKLEGKIVKYDKRNRNCLIEVEFLNKITNVWLPFEYIKNVE